MPGMSRTLSFVQRSWDRNGSGVSAFLGSQQEHAGLLFCRAPVVSRVPVHCEEGMCLRL